MVIAPNAAIHDKSVSARITVAGIQHGVALGQVLMQKGLPFLVAIIAAMHYTRAQVVAEHLHAHHLIPATGAAAVGAIFHRCPLAAIAHQRGYSLGMLVVIFQRIAIQHIVPVQLSAGQCGHHDVIGMCHISGQWWQLVREFPIIHHLGHRRGDTSCHAVLALIDGALVIIGRALTPGTHQQGIHPKRRIKGWTFHAGIRMGVQPLYLLGIVVKQPLQIAGHIVQVKGMVTPCQHLTCTVITRHDIKRAAVIGIQDIIVGGISLDGRWFHIIHLQRADRRLY